MLIGFPNGHISSKRTSCSSMAYSPSVFFRTITKSMFWPRFAFQQIHEQVELVGQRDITRNDVGRLALRLNVPLQRDAVPFDRHDGI